MNTNTHIYYFMFVGVIAFIMVFIILFVLPKIFKNQVKPDNRSRREINEEYSNQLEEFRKRARLLNAQRLVDFDPNDAKNWLALGYAKKEWGKYDESLEALKNAEKLKPDDPDVLNGLAEFQILKRDYAEAIWNLQKALKINSKCITYLSNLGLAFAEHHEYEEAIDTILKISEIERNDGDLYNLGRSYSGLGEYDKAIEKLERLDTDTTNFPGVWYELARIYAIRNELSTAMIHLEKAVNLDGKFKEKAKEDEAFNKLKNSEYFLKLVNNNNQGSHL
ncbi:hypothetical protein COY52_11505 [Candidatus Desantisbacteria bacterium CG_4_10_14_0_8_um_filter_48_22]|uniref:Uncharacterized protein n=1 Tax=Candidatus Desantisbacteria bacterium CG_4_10_14_0_8_um_filter_48_22 TaxID=1974543 RepID=A0A2M7S564_9BACT|nr:MAG: hypothetical protein AUJ67_03890 [Candidatus Desantisbacteria bacterium CG1_02_49_89]PIV57299.1 MAG: hypothetical protein COS16_01180 [Candidatus Desantisbacteria bacterium CG02_land_8_20_14_3_00_49_13]PIZ14677.1 MAG: hypothetical protein COY52_11505 [Candidatus Desantisbacteria bacterium CG_4_10_14_0_8_um_filter_48_22]PJB27228.1 MAG: hypothetical protein CO111_06435 [Candidatus Desantisbacteria bacterium CG_4_9_14_3_um_filter_50_7]